MNSPFAIPGNTYGRCFENILNSLHMKHTKEQACVNVLKKS